jgi:hypothetical protein
MREEGFPTEKSMRPPSGKLLESFQQFFGDPSRAELFNELVVVTGETRRRSVMTTAPNRGNLTYISSAFPSASISP